MRARRRFAQHFLEPAWVAKLARAVHAEPGDRIVEIGPGRGALTRPLLGAGARVLAIEVDRDLARAFDAEQRGQLTLIEGDVLKLDLASAIAAWQGEALSEARQVRVVGNLPYNISSPILFALLALARQTAGLSDATLMLQKEVADRLVAEPGTRDYGVLTILTALRADATRLLDLPPGAFRPVPKIQSTVIRLAFHPLRLDLRDEDTLIRMVRSVFTQRRKTLSNALKPFAEASGTTARQALVRAGFDGSRRPETLQLVELERLAHALTEPDR
jgi:16S rRNA (adenine1518-N6/adenine1519-N6)-dimethyltransferase